MAKATKGMARRGPDDEGVVAHTRAAFGHRRLSILDTHARSSQPMSSACGRYDLVFNGEIYNFRALRRRMEAEGERFETSGDTEVLMRGLMLRGRDFLQDVNGFFALGFYDNQTHELLVARDRYGIKPLYYCETDGRLSFSSTLEGIMDVEGKVDIDRDALTLYLQLTYVPAPLTLLEGVGKIRAGEWMTISEGGTQRGEYYRLPTRANSNLDAGTTARRLRELLEESVHSRLVADVSVGAFLSGGLDSAVILSLACGAGVHLPSFSIGFPDRPYFDETERAAATARHFGVEHHVCNLRDEELAARPEAVLDAFDEPFADSSAVLVNLLSEYASRHVKVALSGDGADELLGGYNKHRALLRSVRPGTVNRAIRSSNGLLKMLPSSRNHVVYDKMRKLKKYGHGLQLSFQERYWDWACFTSSGTVEELLLAPTSGRPRFIGDMLDTLDPDDFNTVLRTDMQLVLANDMLYKVDRMSMHHGLEVRVPFLDHRLVDFLFSVPAEMKMDGRVGKRLLRSAFAGDFPPDHFSGGKRGFEAPLSHWFRGPLHSVTKELLNADRIREQGIFDTVAVERIRSRAVSRAPGDAPHTLWSLLVFQYWHAKYIDRRKTVTK